MKAPLKGRKSPDDSGCQAKKKARFFFVDGHQAKVEAAEKAEAAGGGKKKAKLPSAWLLKSRPDCLGRLERYVRCVDFISNEIGSTPRTVTEWATKVAAARKCPKAPHITGTTPYMRLWSIRAMLLSHMARDGIDRLTVDSSATIRQICEMNPDMSEGLARVRYHYYHSGNSGGAASDFVKKYGNRPELLSMWMCFSIDRGFSDEDFSSFDLQQWTDAANAYLRKERVHPHPAVQCSVDCLDFNFVLFFFVRCT